MTPIRWHKSRRSQNNGNCVEVAGIGDDVAVRDSKLDTTGDFPTLRVPVAEWPAFLAVIESDHRMNT